MKKERRLEGMSEKSVIGTCRHVVEPPMHAHVGTYTVQGVYMMRAIGTLSAR